MAAGDVTLVSTGGRKPTAPTYIDNVDVEGLASYTTGGQALGLALKLPGRSILAVIVKEVGAGAAAKHARFVGDPTLTVPTDKLIFVDEAGAEIANTTDLTGQVIKLVILSE